MKTISILFLLVGWIMLLLMTVPAPAQNTSWTRTYGGNDWDGGFSVQQTQDQGYIVAGKTWSFGAGWYDVYLIKADTLGEVLWTRIYGGIGYDTGNSVRQTTDGGYIIAGYTESYGAGWYDIYLIKTDPQGDTLWTKTYGGLGFDWGTSVQQTTDGGYIVTGYTDSYGAGYNDVYLIKTDSQGDTLWTKTFGDSHLDEAYSVQQTEDGGYIVAEGPCSYEFLGPDVDLLKTDSQGNLIWTKSYGGSGLDYGYSLQKTADGGYVVAGVTESYGAGSGDVYLIKTDYQGDTLWTKTYGGSSYDAGHSVQQTADGGYIVAGFTWSYGAGSADVYLIKTDAEGTVGVVEFEPYVPHKFAFYPPHPNPFNPTTILSFDLPVASLVKLEVFDIHGRVVGAHGCAPLSGLEATPTMYPAGTHQIPFDGSGLPSGIYLARLTAGDFQQTQKMVLLK